MKPVELSSALVRLDQPTVDDAAAVFQYCQDPLFERYLTVPWPYRRTDADAFISEYVPSAWASDTEYVWAVRAPGSPALIGVIGLRLPSGLSGSAGSTGAAGPSGSAGSAGSIGPADSTGPAGSAGSIGSIGYWLGAPNRGRGYMLEALRLVADWAFSTGVVDSIQWQSVPGNVPSARTARRAGFTFLGESPADHPHRDGSHPSAWTARLLATDDRSPKSGWPAET